MVLSLIVQSFCRFVQVVDGFFIVAVLHHLVVILGGPCWYGSEAHPKTISELDLPLHPSLQLEGTAKDVLMTLQADIHSLQHTLPIGD